MNGISIVEVPVSVLSPPADAPEADSSLSSLRPPVLWTAPEYTGSIADLEAKERELGQRLAGIAGRFFRARFASSLAAEDMVVTDAILRGGEAVRAGIRAVSYTHLTLPTM